MVFSSRQSSIYRLSVAASGVGHTWYSAITPRLLWKIIFRYTVIDYNNGFEDQSVVIDFHKHGKNVKITLSQYDRSKSLPLS